MRTASSYSLGVLFLAHLYFDCLFSLKILFKTSLWSEGALWKVFLATDKYHL